MRIWIAVCLFIPTLAAQEDSLGSFELRETVISATRTRKNPFEIGRSVTLIGSNQRGFAISTGEWLTRQTGVYTLGAGQTPGSLQTLQIRGAANHQTSVLIDGFRLADPTSPDNALDLTEITLSDLDRIEIVRGAHGTMYGSSAVGGVVHLISRIPERTGFHGNVRLHGGILGNGAYDHSQYLNLGARTEHGIFIQSDLMLRNVNGLNATIDTVRTPGAFKKLDRDGMTQSDLSGKVGFHNDEWKIVSAWRMIRTNSDIDDGAYRNDENYDVGLRRFLGQLSIEKSLGTKSDVTMTAGYSTFRRRAVDDSSQIAFDGSTDQSYSDGRYEGTSIQSEGQFTRRGRGYEGVAGVGWNRETMSSRFYYLHTAYQFSILSDLDTLDLQADVVHAFAHGDFNGTLIADHLLEWNLGLGIRWNRHDRYGVNWTYEVNPSYRLHPTTLVYASWTTGFTTPSLYRLYAPDKYYTSAITRGNIQLKPERSVTLESGVKQKLDRVEWSAAVYQSVVRNFVEYVYLWDGTLAIADLGTDWMRDDYRGDTYLNIGTQTVQGVEYSVMLRPADALTFNFSGSFLRSRLKYDPSDIDDTKTEGHHVQLYSSGEFLDEKISSKKPVRKPNTASASLLYRVNPKLQCGITSRYVGRRYDVYYNPALGPFGALDTQPMDAYVTSDAVTNVRLSDQLTADIRLHNMFDNRTSEIRGYRSLGRSLFLALRYGW